MAYREHGGSDEREHDRMPRDREKLTGDKAEKGGWSKDHAPSHRSMGHLHPEATGEGFDGTKPNGPAIGHQGHFDGRKKEKVTEHHRK